GGVGGGGGGRLRGGAGARGEDGCHPKGAVRAAVRRMTDKRRLAIPADLHWGIRPAGDAATRLLLDFLRAAPPDLLVLAGDVGAGDEFDPCLALFDDLSCRKALVPGNHDIWVADGDPPPDSLP